MFWGLLANASVATQVVEDRTLSGLIVRSLSSLLFGYWEADVFGGMEQPFYFVALAFFVATLYISLDVTLHITNTFGPSNPLLALHSTPLFILTSIWPGA
jgi:hypothetical protein